MPRGGGGGGGGGAGPRVEETRGGGGGGGGAVRHGDPVRMNPRAREASQAGEYSRADSGTGVRSMPPLTAEAAPRVVRGVSAAAEAAAARAAEAAVAIVAARTAM